MDADIHCSWFLGTDIIIANTTFIAWKALEYFACKAKSTQSFPSPAFPSSNLQLLLLHLPRLNSFCAFLILALRPKHKGFHPLQLNCTLPLTNIARSVQNLCTHRVLFDSTTVQEPMRVNLSQFDLRQDLPHCIDKPQDCYKIQNLSLLLSPQKITMKTSLLCQREPKWKTVAQ